MPKQKKLEIEELKDEKAEFTKEWKKWQKQENTIIRDEEMKVQRRALQMYAVYIFAGFLGLSMIIWFWKLIPTLSPTWNFTLTAISFSIAYLPTFLSHLFAHFPSVANDNTILPPENFRNKKLTIIHHFEIISTAFYGITLLFSFTVIGLLSSTLDNAFVYPQLIPFFHFILPFFEKLCFFGNQNGCTTIIGVLLRVIGLMIDCLFLTFHFTFEDDITGQNDPFLQDIILTGTFGVFGFVSFCSMCFTGRTKIPPLGKIAVTVTVVVLIASLLLTTFVFDPIFHENPGYWSFKSDFFSRFRFALFMILIIEDSFVIFWVLNKKPSDYQNIENADESLPEKNSIEDLNSVTVLIACHKSDGVIIDTLQSIVDVGISNIIVVQNGHRDKTNEKTREFNDENRNNNDNKYTPVKYLYLPKGNKTIALYYAAKHYVKTQYVLTLDDDTKLDIKTQITSVLNRMKECVDIKACAYTICVDFEGSLLKMLQHYEYLQAALNKIYQDDLGTVLYPHGAIALWENSTYLEVLKYHDTEFNGEDMQFGIILRSLKKNYRIICSSEGPAITTPPDRFVSVPSLFGICFKDLNQNPTLLVQRIWSWVMVEQRKFFDLAYEIIFLWDVNWKVTKLYQIQDFWTVVLDWIRIPLIFNIAFKNPINLISIFVFIFFLQVFLSFNLEFIKLSNRPDLKISKSSTKSTFLAIFCVLFTPIYKLCLLGFRIVALILNVTWSSIWIPTPRKISEYEEKDHSIPVIPEEFLSEYKSEEEWSELFGETGN